MTFIYARRYGNEALICGDTWVSDDHGLGDPRAMKVGQLKIVALTPSVTVGFAGHLGAAHYAVRGAAKLIANGAELRSVERFLAKATRDDSCEFIICAHTSGALRFIKLRSGKTANGSDAYTLGDPRPWTTAKPPYRVEDYQTKFAPIFVDQYRFISMFADSGARLTDTVGGFPTMRRCNAEGHHWLHMASTAQYDEIIIKENEKIDLGMDRWNYQSVIPEPDSACFGIYLPQMERVICFDPLVHDEGQAVSALTGAQAKTIVSAGSSYW